MMAYRVRIERDKCMGDAICTALCSNWYMDTDGKARFRQETISDSDYESNHEAEISCPAGIIEVRKA
jgi:ferredoxin